MMRRLVQLRRDDSGTILILALFMVLFVAVALLALAGLAQANLQATTALATANVNSTASDASLDQVITQILSDDTVGKDPSGSGGPCSGQSTFTIPAGTYDNDSPVTVKCVADPDSGKTTTTTTTTTTTSNGTNSPDAALLATSESETGINVGGNTNNDTVGSLNIDGSVFSNSQLSAAQGGSISVSQKAVLKTQDGGTIRAVGECAGPADNYDPHCDGGKTAQPDYRTDSKWDHETLPGNVVSDSAVSGACGLGNGLSKGIYNNADALNALIAGCNGVLWFKPGVYYFDFTSASHVLTIGNANVHIVGGVPGSDPTDPVDGCDKSQDGVQFIFGGDSQISLTSGTMDLCPIQHDDRQQISIYGLRQDVTTASADLKDVPPGSTSGAPNSSKGSFSNPDRVSTFDDGKAATYAWPTGNGTKKDGALVASGFDLSAIPSGSTITSAKVRVKYATDAASFGSLALTLTDGDGTKTISSDTSTSCDSSSGTLCLRGTSSDFFDQTFSLPATATASGIKSLSVEFDASPAKTTGSSTDKSAVDGISVSVTYKPPVVYHAQSGCVTQTGGGGCTFFNATGNNTDLNLRGTFYAWDAQLALNLPNNIGAAIRRGVVARVVDLNVPNSFSQTDAVISLPHDTQTTTQTTTTTADRVVVLVASIDGRDIIRTKVRFKDNEDGTAEIKHWSDVG